ncbi:carcinine hydrolase/isopenicillin-N N-acyltransferase family protein [Actinophytocola gossypii]|uniref:Linear amide C-N hydrolase n=1 Tax=Actinophytocola gossypii TaxID=2812003 RepID=A0ABT2JBG9_9PSEU|nr:carcinine hydrolase/isopenicillin-N N-acyltransferase family protein [Actinophytocola gossypii]MCT2585192.1 linear amide C-N hydrolase [Actinophytocola gossypii]
MRRLVAVVALVVLALSGCQTSPAAPRTAPDWRASLDSLEKLDDHPLWTMRYEGGYDRMKGVTTPPPATPYGCSLFLAGAEADPLFARNFDWNHGPAMLLFTDPPDGHASVSMVDLRILGAADPAGADRDLLVDAPLLPVDGMNAEGLAIGLAAVPEADTGTGPERPTVGGLRAIRLVLDEASTVDEAVAVFEEHNIDFSGGPSLHYLVADATGRSVVIEFVDGEVSVLPVRTAVNFTMAESTEESRQADRRYRTATEGLPGATDWRSAMDLLDRVRQNHTQWSVVYGLRAGDIHLATAGNLDRVHDFDLAMAG